MSSRNYAPNGNRPSVARNYDMPSGTMPRGTMPNGTMELCLLVGTMLAGTMPVRNYVG